MCRPPITIVKPVHSGRLVLQYDRILVVTSDLAPVVKLLSLFGSEIVAASPAAFLCSKSALGSFLTLSVLAEK